MPSAAETTIDALLREDRLSAASAAIDRWRVEPPRTGGALARLGAGLYALAGCERDLVRTAEPGLLACASAADVAAYLDGSSDAPRAYDYLAAGVMLTWRGDASGAYGCLESAHDRAVGESRFAIAVAARERLAHHALLFGDLAIAREAIREAEALAATHGLSNWRRRCAAVSARLALDAGESDRAATALDEALAAALAPDALAYFAATGAQLARERDDSASLRKWSSPAILDAALQSEWWQSSVPAAIACAIASEPDVPLPPPAAIALRRALLQIDGAANVPELFSIAARCGDPDEAEFAADALHAVVAPRRKYLYAHRLLARAYLQFRAGDRSGAIDSAGDAARAFEAIGMRRWTNEAMGLLVHRERPRESMRRRRPSALSLTGREQQVAHLIRRGASNREVAGALQISEHTVERHVSSILSRLGLRSRWQIADSRKVETQS